MHAPTRSASLAAGVVIALATLRALWLARDDGLLGLDAYPLVLAARPDSLAGLLGGLARPLFGDWMPAPYFRPVLHLSFAFDALCFGLAPLGYHATSALLFALASLALLALTRTLGLGALGSLVAVAVFVSHPVLGTVLPAPARRADVLCLLFLALALRAQVQAARSDRRVAWRPALFAALAIGSKETGFVVPALCGVATWLYAPAAGARARVRATAVALLPHLAVTLLAAGARVAVLGSFSGGRPVDPAAGLTGAWPMLLRLLEWTLTGRGAWPGASGPGVLLAGAVLATPLAAALSGTATRSAIRTAAARPAALAGTLFVLLSAGYAIGGLLQPWYLLMPAAAAAWLLGAWSDGARIALRRGRGAARAAGGAALLLLALLVASLASHSILLRGDDDWDRASARMARYLAAADRVLSDARAGEEVALPAPPAFVGSGADGARLRGVVVLAPYSVRAWARLTHPDTPVRILDPAPPRAAVAERGAGGRPDVVLIVADDLGYADLGFQGSETFATPRLDGLAAQGVRFTNAYVTSPLCAPSRAGLLTGRDPNRFGYTTATGTYQRQMRDDVGVSLDETLLSEALHRGGYATAAVGKWHLGVRPRYRPLARGFDRFFGFLAGTHAYFDWGPGLYGPVFRGNQRAEGDTYLTDAFAREAADFVRSRREREAPFFLYVAFHAVHGPHEVPDRYLEAVAHVEPELRRRVAAMTLALDEGVGRILDALEETGRARDTLVVFLNDNGGLPPLSSNAPLRGGKGSLLEGGIRVPFVVRWPARLAPGVYERPVSALDVFPTVLAAADVAPPRGRALDGVDLLPHLRDPGGEPPHPVLRWRYQRASAIRRGDWKLLRGPHDPMLFDLARDVGEERNLADVHPDVAAELLRDLEAWTATLPR